jgi:hypothetical protein
MPPRLIENQTEIISLEVKGVTLREARQGADRFLCIRPRNARRIGNATMLEPEAARTMAEITASARRIVRKGEDALDGVAPVSSLMEAKV